MELLLTHPRRPPCDASTLSSRFILLPAAPTAAFFGLDLRPFERPGRAWQPSSICACIHAEQPVSGLPSQQITCVAACSCCSRFVVRPAAGSRKHREREERHRGCRASGSGSLGVSDGCSIHSVEDVSQASRAISTARLHVLPRFHLPPINVLVSHGPSESYCSGSAHLEGGFPLRCFQRLSLPDVATRRCPWRDNRYTRGQSIPVLSY